jgi:tRNA (cytidine56-2'-O)-methyltransferase
MCACALEQGLGVDRQVAVQGALLHDIGRSVTQDVRHASVGADLLRSDGPGAWDGRVVLCVERHTGAGIDAAEAKALGLPVRDYTPRTIEEKIVAHADNLHSGDKRLTLDGVVAKYHAKGLPEAAAKIRRLHGDLEGLLKVDLERLEPSSLALPGPG